MIKLFSEADIAKMMATFDKHKAEPHVSIDAHVRARSIELGKNVDSRAAVYLDQRFWIFIRDAAFNRSDDSSSINLLNLLRELVNRGKIFCPISEPVFIELLKQSDLVTRSLSDLPAPMLPNLIANTH